jgi:WhiB family redox-sensing transcriptional regulator
VTSRAAEPYWPTIATLPGEWVNDANCADSPFKDAFHPSTEDGRDAKREAQYAKAVCKTCTVRNECLQWALEVGPALAGGILGGISEDARRDLLRGRRVA